MDLIYASTKDKIPGSFSYCVQKSDLDGALICSMDGAVEVSFLRFHERNILDPEFWSTPVYGLCPVMSLRYMAPTPRSTCLSHSRPGRNSPWRLCIYAVPKSLRNHIRTACVTAHLPALNAWLSEAKTETWFLTDHRKTVFFDPATQQLSLQDEKCI